jgi:hypothetical protein
MLSEEIRKYNSARGGRASAAVKWQRLCVCGHKKIAHWRKAHASHRQTGRCKDCACQTFQEAP